MTGTYKIADEIIFVESVYPTVHEYYRGYEATGTPDFSVKTSVEDIVFERERTENGEMFPDSYLEEIAMYRKICEKMPYYDTFLFHGSCIAVDGEGYLFGAPSGTGKSTHAKLWCDNLGERAVMVNDDKPLLRICGDGTYAYGTPYNGKHRRGENTKVRLKAICMLSQSPDNGIREITRSEAYPLIIGQTYRPYDREAFVKTLDLVDRLFENVKLYSLRCNMEKEAFEVSYNKMREA